MKNYYSYTVKIGDISIVEENGNIVEIAFGKPKYLGAENETHEIKKAIQQLREYFDGKRKTFDFNMKAQGTEFQHKVWNALQTIAYGELCSYKQIAEKIGNPKASRAVGMANNKNPLPIVVPCHRVVGANGKLVGYASGLGIKEYLINLEKNNCQLVLL